MAIYIYIYMSETATSQGTGGKQGTGRDAAEIEAEGDLRGGAKKHDTSKGKRRRDD
jgi:hypothetical protein